MTVHAQAVSLLQSGEAAVARRLLQAQADESAHHAFLLGACAHALGDIPDALKLFTAALRRDPAHAPAACALGSLYAGLGHPTEAEALFRQTLTHIEDDQLHFNLAVVLEDQGRVAEALQEYGALLRRTPGHYGARHNRAGLLSQQERLAEAAEDYRQLVEQHPEETLPRHNLGELELALGHYDAAARLLQEVLTHAPDNSKARLSLAVAQAAQGEIAVSAASFAELRRQDAARWEEARARVNGKWGEDQDIDPRLIFLIRQYEHLLACNWRQWPQYGAVFRDFLRSPSDGDAMSLAYLSMAAPLEAADQLALTRHIAGQVARRCTPFTHAVPTERSRLRIGYAATRFGNHVTGLLLRNFFAAHDPDAVEIFALSLGPDDGSANLKTLRATPNLNWIDLYELDDADAAQRIHALDLDILIDLAVYNDDPRPGVLARRPAPLQVVWLGAAYSSGAPWMDYLLADAVVSPGTGWCSEAEVQLPGCYFVHSHDGVPAVPARDTLGLPAEKFVFASLNLSAKIEPEIFDSWMRLLQQAPNSVLWLLGGHPAQVLNLKREAEWRSVDPRRLLFAPRVSPAAHLARQGAADLFLDTRTFNGHTTVAESLWAGTPVLTCPGRTFASRVGASLVQSCGLAELVVASGEEYEAKALALYHDRAALRQLRERLATPRLDAPSFNLRQQAAQMEKAFHHMHERRRRGLAPTAFRVADLPD